MNFLGKKEDYLPKSLSQEGFIHFSNKEQLLQTAHRYFLDEKDLWVLAVDVDKLNAKLVYEDLLGRGEVFPHLYGPLNLSAVYAINKLKKEDDRFVLDETKWKFNCL